MEMSLVVIHQQSSTCMHGLAGMRSLKTQTPDMHSIVVQYLRGLPVNNHNAGCNRYM